CCRKPHDLDGGCTGCGGRRAELPFLRPVFRPRARFCFSLRLFFRRGLFLGGLLGSRAVRFYMRFFPPRRALVLFRYIGNTRLRRHCAGHGGGARPGGSGGSWRTTVSGGVDCSFGERLRAGKRSQLREEGKSLARTG